MLNYNMNLKKKKIKKKITFRILNVLLFLKTKFTNTRSVWFTPALPADRLTITSQTCIAHKLITN